MVENHYSKTNEDSSTSFYYFATDMVYVISFCSIVGIVAPTVSYMTLADQEQPIQTLLSAIENGFERLSTRMNALDCNTSARFDAMEANILARFDAMEAKIFTRMDMMEANISARINTMEANMSAQFDAIEANMSAALNVLNSIDANTSTRMNTMEAHSERPFDAVTSAIMKPQTNHKLHWLL